MDSRYRLLCWHSRFILGDVTNSVRTPTRTQHNINKVLVACDHSVALIMVRRWCSVATVALVCMVACGTVLAVAAAANTASSDKLIRIPIASTPTRRLARQYQYDVKLVTQHTYAGEHKKVLIAGKRYVNPTRERQSHTLCERACVGLC